MSEKLYLWIVRYYTLSDGHESREIVAETADEAEQEARRRDATFDRIESIGAAYEMPAELRVDRSNEPGKRCPECGTLHIENKVHCDVCGAFFF